MVSTVFLLVLTFGCITVMSQSTVDENEDEALSPSQPQLQQQVVEMMLEVNQMKRKLDSLQQKQINKFDQLQQQVNQSSIFVCHSIINKIQ